MNNELLRTRVAALRDDVRCFEAGFKALEEIESELRFDFSEGNQERYANTIAALDRTKKAFGDAQKELSAAIENAPSGSFGPH